MHANRCMMGLMLWGALCAAACSDKYDVVFLPDAGDAAEPAGDAVADPEAAAASAPDTGSESAPSEVPVPGSPAKPAPCDFVRVGESPFWAYECNPVFSTEDEAWAPAILSASIVMREVKGEPFFHLWYIGAPHPRDGLGDYGLGHAVSADGATWYKSEANPLLTETPVEAWDADNMENIQVVWDPEASQYVMTYMAYNLSGWHTYGLGVATSMDGERWARAPENPVVDHDQWLESVPEWRWPQELSLAPGGGFSGYAAGAAVGVRGHPTYRIHAKDPATWTIEATPCYPAGEAGEFDSLGLLSLSVVELDGVHYMFHVGVSDTVNYTTSWVMDGKLGWATSRDGETWTRGLIAEAQIEGFPTGPGPLELREAPSDSVVHVDAVRVDDRIHLWVTDTWDGRAAIGYYLFDPQRARAETP